MLGIGNIITFWLHGIDRNILKASDHKALEIVPQLYQANDILEVEVPKYQVSACSLIVFTSDIKEEEIHRSVSYQYRIF